MTDLFIKYFLFSNPTLLSEVGRVLDLGSTMNEYNSSPAATVADYLALKSDWCAVGSDLNDALKNHVQEKTR
jgi:hypothetical protein